MREIAAHAPVSALTPRWQLHYHRLRVVHFNPKAARRPTAPWHGQRDIRAVKSKSAHSDERFANRPDGVGQVLRMEPVLLEERQPLPLLDGVDGKGIGQSEGHAF